MKQKVLIIVGPTASGKSDLAVRLAKKLNGEIISADSRQVYKGLDVGTGKITKKEMLGIPHYLLDVADPMKQFSVVEYKNLASKALKEIVAKNKLPIIVGGTGFYIKAIACDVLFPAVPPNARLREKLSKLSAEELFKMLTLKDRNRAQNIDPKNKVRLIRALEIVDALGKVPEIQKQNSNYEFIYIGLKPDQKVLEEKILTRLKLRMPKMIKEAETLHKKGLSWQRMEELGLEYRYLARLLQKKLAKEQFEKELFSEIKKYSKRQMTWFKANKEITWFETLDDAFDTIRI
jgi:tRNA dimethylallyltransferase